MSLKRAVEIALTPDGSAKVALARQSIRQAETQVQEARGAFLPNVDGTLQDHRQTTNLRSFGFNFSFPIPGFSIPSIVGPYNVFDARASIQQNVLDFTVLGKYKASRSELAAAKSDLNVVRDQVSDQVARAYLTSLRADTSLETARANVALSEALVRLAQQQKDAGTGTGIEVTRALVQLANDRQLMIVAESDRLRALLQLSRAMGLSLDAPVRLTGTLGFQEADLADEPAAMKLAMSMRTDLQSQKQKEQTAKLNFSSVKAERLPSLSAAGDYGTIGSGLVGAHPTYTAGVSLRVPIYDGGRRDARREDSNSQYRQEQIRTHDLVQQIELDVRVALISLASARNPGDGGAGGLESVPTGTRSGAPALSGGGDQFGGSDRRADPVGPRPRQSDRGSVQLQRCAHRPGDGHGNHRGVCEPMKKVIRIVLILAVLGGAAYDGGTGG